MADPNKGLFDHQYGRFVANRDRAEGYDFQHQTAGNVPPPLVTFTQKLRWWTWDRWKRRKKIREERDRRLQQIIRLQSPKTPPSR
jgi:hypothetical protein